MVDALAHIKLVAKEEDCTERYNPLVYFLLATTQLLNPSISALWEISVASHVDENIRQKFKDHRQAFVRYHLQDPVTKKGVIPPPEQEVEAYRGTANVTERRENDNHHFDDSAMYQGQRSQPVSRSDNNRSVSPATSQVKRNYQERNQGYSRSSQHQSLISSSRRQASLLSGGPRRSTQQQPRSAYAEKRIRTSTLPPPPPSQQAGPQLLVPPIDGTTSEAEAQRMMMSILLNVQSQQQE